MLSVEALHDAPLLPRCSFFAEPDLYTSSLSLDLSEFQVCAAGFFKAVTDADENMRSLSKSSGFRRVSVLEIT